MEKNQQLNQKNIKTQCQQLGFNQSTIAKKLNVTRETVSQWLKNNKSPRPNHLLMLGKLLNLEYNDIVNQDNMLVPKVLFRKRGNVKIRQQNYEDALDKAKLLELMSDFTPFDNYVKPPTLISPKIDYDYANKIAKKYRKQLKIEEQVVKYNELINIFKELKAILIPVLWGKRDKHENAIHIRSLKTMTTWIFINLDTSIFDFKFWMAHELGHVLSPDLDEEKAEDFADQFAGAFLFPDDAVGECCQSLKGKRDRNLIIDCIYEMAKQYMISPYTVYKQVFAYAKNRRFKLPDINIGPAVTNFYKSYSKTISEHMFEKSNNISPKEYVTASNKHFKTPFFKILSSYIKKNKKEEGFIRRLLGLSISDSRRLYDELS